jgi:hypothetical protein
MVALVLFGLIGLGGALLLPEDELTRAAVGRMGWSGCSRSKTSCARSGPTRNNPPRPLEEQVYGFIWNRKQKYGVN